MKKFKILKTEKILDEPFLQVQKELVQIPNGETRDWWVQTGADAVVVIPQSKSGQIGLQQTYKHGSREIVLEFPAGMIDAGETPEDAAARELGEETGLKAEKLTLLGEAFMSPTGSRRKHFFFAATGCEKVGEKSPEADEQIEFFWVRDWTAAENEIRKSTKSSTGILAAAFLGREFFGGKPAKRAA